MMSEAYAVVLGKFDALHIGHRALVQAAAAHASPLLMSFSGMTEILGWQQRAPLMSKQQRVEILASWSAQEVVIPFAEVQTLNAESFIEYLRQRWTISAMLSGEDFRFAYQRSGDVACLRELGRKHSFIVETVEAQKYQEQIMSSSVVRAAVDNGDMQLCHHALDRPFRISGTVTHGQQRGRTIGFPTANLGAIENHIPATGVYAARVSLNGGQKLLSAVNIGHLPSIDAQLPLSVEAHILDWQGDCYGQNITIDLYQRIRSEQKFSSLDELQAQIARDVHAVRALRVY